MKIDQFYYNYTRKNPTMKIYHFKKQYEYFLNY